MSVKLEHHKQRLATWPVFLQRLLRYSLFALALLTLSLGIGTIGYHTIAELNWIDSFHMTCMILTGMGPVADMTTDRAKMFSSLYALYSGIAFLSITGVFLAPIVHRLLHILQIERDEDRD